MEISLTQLINPAIFDFDDQRRKEIGEFKDAVRQARFLSDEKKRRWNTMAYLLTDDQLAEAQKFILVENLQRLKTQGKLEKLKPKEK
ncbi:MAG: hypothetical protein V1908_02550 [Candidatus Peregrinibacteria bacterium]